jgi:hypothetical protein
VLMLTETRPFTAQGGHQHRLDAGVDYLSWVWSLCRGHPSTAPPHRVHRRCTAFPIRTHHMDATPSGPPLRYRPVRPTPLYDQLRGERINAEVPPSDPQPHQGQDCGKHRLPHDELSSMTASTRPPRIAAHRVHTDLSPREANPHQPGHPAKHHIPDGEPTPPTAFTQPPPAADRAASWSWFATAALTSRPR